MSWIFLVALATGLPASPVPEGRWTCLTPRWWPLPAARAQPGMRDVRAGEQKTERDAVGTYPNVLYSTNFALKWGDDRAIPFDHAEDLLENFETAWTVEVKEMAHPFPLFSRQYLFNVYLGDTGSGTPSSLGYGGYYYVDDEGYPMIVINPDVLSDATARKGIAPHELYHAIQHATGSYTLSRRAAWYAEASAEWIVPEVFPQISRHGEALGAVALQPHYPIHHFDYPDTGSFLEMHQYGAFIFPRFLSEQVADRQLIRDSWVLTDDAWADPLVVLDGLLEPNNVTIGQAFGEFAAHNATWDYAYGDIYQFVVDSFVLLYPEYDQRFAVTLNGQGTTDWVTAPTETLPQQYGYNLIRLQDPHTGWLTVRFEGDAVGSDGSAASWIAVVVREHSAGPEYVPVPLAPDPDGTAGQLDIADVGNDKNIYLAVSALSDSSRSMETFAYRFQLRIGPPPGPTLSEQYQGKPGAPNGCRATGGSLFSAVLFGLMIRRRRTQHSLRWFHRENPLPQRDTTRDWDAPADRHGAFPTARVAVPMVGATIRWDQRTTEADSRMAGTAPQKPN